MSRPEVALTTASVRVDHGEKLLSIRGGDLGCFVTAPDLNRRQQVDGLNPDAGHRIPSQASIAAKL
jgi:hypothetical protein